MIHNDDPNGPSDVNILCRRSPPAIPDKSLMRGVQVCGADKSRLELLCSALNISVVLPPKNLKSPLPLPPPVRGVFFFFSFFSSWAFLSFAGERRQHAPADTASLFSSWSDESLKPICSRWGARSKVEAVTRQPLPVSLASAAFHLPASCCSDGRRSSSSSSFFF